MLRWLVRQLRWAQLLPPYLLILLAAYHIWLVQTEHLSRWLGGGFGMFSTTDVDSARQVRLIAIADTDRQPVPLPEQLHELMQRFRGLPDSDWAERLAKAVLAEHNCPGKPCPYEALVIELWLTDYQVDTLQPTEHLVRHFRFAASP